MRTYWIESIQDSSDPLIQETKNGQVIIRTKEYESQVIPDEKIPKVIQTELIWKANFPENINNILLGKPIERSTNYVPLVDVQYPDDIKWNLRYEWLSSIWYRDEWDIQFLTRKRPNIDKTNTPGAEDAGVIFHGIDNWQVISPRRFMADNMWKSKDDEITWEQLSLFSRFYGDLFKSYELIVLGHLILTSWSIARQDETPTSAMMQGNVILLSRKQVENILAINENYGNNNYTLRSARDTLSLPNPANWENVPKLEAYLELLRGKI